MNKTQIVADYIKNKINMNILGPGDKIYTEKELMKELNLSHTTVRAGLKMLSDEKIIYTVQGSGSYVTESVKDTVLILVAEFSVFNNINNFYIQLIDNLKSLIEKENLKANLLMDKKNAGFSMNINYEKIAGVICISNSSTDLYEFEKRNIPIVAMPPKFHKYPNVRMGIMNLYNQIFDLHKKYSLKNNIVLFYKFSHDIFDKKNEFDPFEYIRANYSVFEIQYNTNHNIIKNRLRNYFDSINEIPDSITFLDNTIYITAQELFNEYSHIFKNTKIITHSNKTEIFPEDYKICRLEISINQVSDSICDILFKMIRGECVLCPNKIIQPVIVNEEIFS